MKLKESAVLLLLLLIIILILTTNRNNSDTKMLELWFSRRTKWGGFPLLLPFMSFLPNFGMFRMTYFNHTEDEIKCLAIVLTRYL